LISVIYELNFNDESSNPSIMSELKNLGVKMLIRNIKISLIPLISSCSQLRDQGTVFTRHLLVLVMQTAALLNNSRMSLAGHKIEIVT